MITQFVNKIKFCMAESGGHDPHPPKADDSFIGRSPNLWDSLSNHDIIISEPKQTNDPRVLGKAASSTSNYPLTATQVKSLYNDGAYRTGPTTGAP